MKELALKRPDTCGGCTKALRIGERAVWDASARTTWCLTCRQAPVPPVMPTSAAGASAQREYDKRSERREASVRSRYPRLGGLILALSNEPTSTQVWAQGAYGERAVAAKLDELAGSHLIALHDRKMIRADGRSTRANIDHLAVTSTGVWVIDAKTHRGSLEVRRSGGLFSPRIERLYIAGRDKSSLLQGLAGQVDAVRAVLTEVGADVRVRGALCFVGTELPWFGESVDGVPLVGRRGLAKLMKKEGDLDGEARDVIAEYLSLRFLPA